MLSCESLRQLLYWSKQEMRRACTKVVGVWLQEKGRCDMHVEDRNSMTWLVTAVTQHQVFMRRTRKAAGRQPVAQVMQGRKEPRISMLGRWKKLVASS